ncbi:hypothetical protein [Vibrio litoralis]|uniref:hypothetical protein n=1 Tax=Vibrio litoralis TaxID=335972 RepID=UPI00186615A2|nr:hypothetical protein [Vibrio litoralis]
MASPLADLDELVLKCRDEKAKKYIKEAVNCYKSGAFRSAIVSTWIAVTFDLIDKFKELSALGDKEAEKQVEEIEKARRINDISRFLQLEREIIDVARDKLELISHTESIDLERLQEDRNRCAHPSMNLDGDIFNPSAELARLHISSAVNHLLQYPPSQGKYALDQLFLDIESNYFPSSKKDILLALKNSPLIKPRHSLLRNFMVILIKKALSAELDHFKINKLYFVLSAISELHNQQYNEILSKDLSKIVLRVPDEELNTVTTLLINLNDSWVYLDDVAQVKINTYVTDLPKDDMPNMELLLNYEPLKASAEKRLSHASMSELISIVPFDMDARIIDRMIELYGKVGSFYAANDWVQETLIYVDKFSVKQVEQLIKVASENSQITGSNEYPRLIKAVRNKKIISETDLNKLLVKFEMQNLVVKTETETSEKL